MNAVTDSQVSVHVSGRLLVSETLVQRQGITFYKEIGKTMVFDIKLITFEQLCPGVPE